MAEYDKKPLSYRKDVLIETLNERLSERKQKREADKEKTAERNKVVVDQLVELMNEYPTFLLHLVNHLSGLNSGTGEDWGKPGTPEFKTATEKYYGWKDKPGEQPGAVDPDEDLNKLIRVYDKAEDETVEVHVTDEVYDLL